MHQQPPVQKKKQSKFIIKSVEIGSQSPFLRTADDISEEIDNNLENIQQQVQPNTALEVVQEETEDALQQSEEIVKNSLAKHTPQIAVTA